MVDDEYNSRLYAHRRIWERTVKYAIYALSVYVDSICTDLLDVVCWYSMANDTRTIKQRERIASNGRSTSTKRKRLAFPQHPWEPTPLEQRVRAMAIRQAYGLLAGKGPRDVVAWQRKIRAGSSARLEEQHRLWKALRKNKKMNGRTRRSR